jgi:minor extracellular serine protease Vpr
MRINSIAASGRPSAELSSSFARALASIAAFAAVMALGAPALAQDATARFKLLNESQPLQSARQPLSLLNKERIHVVVVMSAPSVAEARGARVDHQLSAQEHDAIHAQVMQQHATVTGTIAARGGRVLTHYADALNGVRVEIERGEVAGLASLPGVVSVLPVATHQISNVVSVPYIGAPAVWQGVPGLRGEHVKIAIIDTGIDYTHANFGGPGTVAAFNTAAASSTLAADPALFGPSAPKVKGGIDLVGDAYDAGNPSSVPMPDPNPLDCNGHGSHVAGTAAGFGVANDGTTYHGPYNQGVYASGFGIGPGVAPLADLYAVRVFGCNGSSNVIAEGIDWAVHNGMDVINMSLGAPFGTATTSDALASDNAAKAGVIVVAAAGNDGPNPYVLSTPGSAAGALSVAATDAHPTFAAVRIALSSGIGVDAVEANGLPLPGGTIPALILTAGGKLSLGCNASDYPSTGAAGAIVIISRGTCTFTSKATNAMAAGAVAIGVVNNGAGYFNPLLTGVTIPFLELLKSDGPALAAAPKPITAMLSNEQLPNPNFAIAASFSSGGPRSVDSALKPDVTAPGVAVISTGIGTGNGTANDSGTSMATPHVAGVAALVRQAHPHWSTGAIRAAVIESASPAALLDYAPRIEGAGLVQALGATSTDVVVRSDGERPGKLSFGFAEFTHNFHDDREVVIENHGSSSASFTVSATAVGGVPHTINLSRSHVTVGAHDDAELRVSVEVPVGTVGSTHDAAGNVAFEEVAGVITLTPTGSSNHGVALTVPYYFVPRARADVDAKLRGDDNPFIRLSNDGGAIAGFGDFYAWGLNNPKTGAILASFEPRAVGVQSNPISATNSVLVFAVNTYGRFSNAAQGEYDIYLDVNGDGVPDYVLFVADSGLVTTGRNASGLPGVFLFNLATGTLVQQSFADAPTDGSTVLMPVLASHLGLSPSNPRFTYFVNAFDGMGGGETVAGTASFNVFTPSVSNAMFVAVAPHTRVDVPVGVDPVEFAKTPALGFMVVTEDNASGRSQANLLPLQD